MICFTSKVPINSYSQGLVCFFHYIFYTEHNSLYELVIFCDNLILVAFKSKHAQYHWFQFYQLEGFFSLYFILNLFLSFVSTLSDRMGLNIVRCFIFFYSKAIRKKASLVTWDTAIHYLMKQRLISMLHL